MEPVSQNDAKQQDQGPADLSESVASSETSFGPFVVPEVQQGSDQGSSSGTSFSLEYNPPFLPPEAGQSALYMLNLEIQAHTHTEENLRQVTMKASSLERHYVHQSIALAAWQASYKECCANVQRQAEEIEQLKTEIERLREENQRLKEETCSWRETFRPASA
ncbi:hypothetical protein SLS56_005177 [Neofusicoccum ribis]|uniref:Uncharacterized protein n=1 Tax=Neofusicoccum ribis TaxID=45134 RepID=A0ABR3SUG0_9PEZI